MRDDRIGSAYTHCLRLIGRQAALVTASEAGAGGSFQAAALQYCKSGRDAVRLLGLWALAPRQYALLGLWTGFGFMLAELPNSFLKRQLDVAPGAAPKHPVGKSVCFLLDRFDSILGLLFAAALVVPTPWELWALLLLAGSVVHWLFSVLLFALGVKERPA